MTPNKPTQKSYLPQPAIIPTHGNLPTIATLRLHSTNTLPKTFFLHGGPGAQGSLHGLAKALATPCAEVLQTRAQNKPLTVQNHVEDLATLLPKDPTLVGHSWGAMLALSYAATHPDSVKNIVLVGCGTYSKTSRAEYERRTAERTDPAKKAALKAALQNAKTPEESASAFADYAHYATSVQVYDPIPDPYPGPPGEYDPNALAATWPDVLRLQAEAVEPQRFTRIQCPVTLVQGEQDPHPGPHILQDLKPYIPHIAYHSLPLCGHEPWLERNARAQFLKLLATLIVR